LPLPCRGIVEVRPDRAHRRRPFALREGQRKTIAYFERLLHE
jgi:hypothetical protein